MHLWLEHASPAPQGAHDLVIPHPNDTGSQLVAGPPSFALAHVSGVQHWPL